MFRFTIRDVLWLTVVVACAVAWWLDRKEVLRREEAKAIVIQEAAERAVKETAIWKFRAEALQKHVNREGTATFRQGDGGREEVTVETKTGANAYYDPRWFVESTKGKAKLQSQSSPLPTKSPDESAPFWRPPDNRP